MLVSLNKLSGLIFLVLLWIFTIGCSRDLKSAPTSNSDSQQVSAPRTSIPLDVGVDKRKTASPMPVDPFKDDRHNMVDSTIESRGISNPDVLQSMREVKRHYFVPEKYISQAYADHPIPIGYGQTISQPYIVALMTELLELDEGDKVLEIGTGSGYQAAVLAELDYVDVYSIEIIPALSSRASELIESLGYDNVKIKQSDGYFGWTEYAPFDAIIITAAPDHLPAPLADQLKEGGRLVVPIGPPGGYQTLWKFEKENGDLKAYNLGGVSFVPFTGEGIEGLED